MAENPAISADQKAAMAAGRRETRIVEAYLRHLEAVKKTVTRRSIAEIKADLAQVELDLVGASMLERLNLFQERENLQREALEAAPELDGQIEEQFIAIARSYSDRKGVSYSTWREIGVTKEVLEAAGIPRTRRPNQALLKSLSELP